MTGLTPTERRRVGWRVVTRAVRRQRRLVGAAVACGTGWQLVLVVVPLVLGWIVDRGIEGGEREAIWLGALAILVLGVAEAALDAGRHWAENAASAYVAQGLREDVAGAVLAFGDEERDRFPAGDVVARATDDVDHVADLLDSLGYTVAYALTAPVIVVLMAAIDVSLGLVALAATAVTAVAVWRSTRLWERRSATVQEAVGATVARAQEALDGFKTFRGLGAEATALRRFDAESAALRDSSRRAARLWMLFEPLLEVLSLLTVIAVLWVGGEAVIAGRLGLGEVVAGLGLALLLVTPVRVVSEWTVGLQTALASAARIGELVDAAPHRDKSAAQGEPGSLEAAGLVFAYPARSRVLENVDLQLRRGDVALLRGPVGSGKSTLLRLLAGRRVPARGMISLSGAPVHRDQLRRQVLLIEQAPHVLGTTVRANLHLGRPGASHDELLEAAELVDAAEFIVALPDGLDTTIGDRGATLSGGQRQRLALARAVLARPGVLLLDAATSDLDPAREAAVLGRVAEHWRDGIVLIVSANPAASSIATATIEVRDGVAEVRR